MNPLLEAIEPYRYETWTPTTETKLREKILSLKIPGLTDVVYETTSDRITVKPLFATEQDHMWYVLKYVNSL